MALFKLFPGRKVHVSNKTLGFLDGAFETERAYGEKREEMLRAANITTYFITKVLKPVSTVWYNAIVAKPRTIFSHKFSKRSGNVHIIFFRVPLALAGKCRRPVICPPLCPT